MPEIGDTLRILRRDHGYSQEELSDLIGVTRFTIANYESGRRKPTIMILRKLSTLYKVSLDQITETDSVDSTETLITMSRIVFSSTDISKEQKEKAFHAIMQAYLSSQAENKT